MSDAEPQALPGTEDTENEALPMMAPGVRRTVWLLAGLMPFLSILWGLQVAPEMGIALFKEQYLAIILGLSLGSIFLTKPFARGKRGSLPWYDGALALLSIGTLFFIAYDYQRFQLDFPYQTVEMLVIGGLVFALVMEALRRATGWVLFTIVLLFMGYALVGHLVPAPLTGRSNTLAELMPYLAFDTNAALGTPMSVAAVIVILFIFFGRLLVNSGCGEFFIDLATAGMGRRRGGSAKVSVMASALFGSISGSAISNVATTGVITIPLMRRSGYTNTQAGAIETIASTGGQLMPPIMGAAAFLMAEFLEIPYAEVVLAALIPAVFYYFAVFVQVDLIAARGNIKVIEKDLPKVSAVLKAGWHFLIPFAVLLFALFYLNAEAEIAALYAAIAIIGGGLLKSYNGRKLRPGQVVSAFSEAGLAMLELIIIVAAAGIVIGILNITSGGFALTLFLVQMGGSNLALLLAISAGVCILLGMGMPTSGVYVLLAALVAPALIETGIDRLAAHMFILYFGMMSMITPPIALAAFAAATISGAKPMQTGFESMKLGWVAYIVPILFVLSPSLIMNGETGDIVFNTATAVAGVYVVSVAVVGYFARPLPAALRTVLVVAGLAAMMPQSVHALGTVISLAGIGVALLILGRERLIGRSAATPAAENGL